MKKFLLLIIFLIAICSVSGQSTVTIGKGSSISVGTSSSLTASYRDGSMSGAGSYNTRSIMVDPTCIAATSIIQTGFNANWNVSAGAIGYKLDVSVSSSFSSFVSVYQNLDVGNVTTYPITGLSASTTYYYRTRGYESDGITGYSNVISVLTVPQACVATAASNITDVSISANWNSSTGATGYRLDVSTNSNFDAGTFVAGFENKDVSNVTTYSVTGLSGNTTYYYRIRAYNAGGTSLNSNVITVLSAPSPPNAIAASSINQSSFSANWNSSAGATGYKLDVSTNSSFNAGTFVTGYQNLDVGNVTTYSVSTNLTSGTTYYYRVRAYDATGTSGNSNTINLITVPPTPVSLAASNIASTSFDANWSVSTGATKYYLDVSTDAAFGAGNFVTDYENKDADNVTTFTVNTNLTGGNTYYYRVRANNASGTSGNSGSISVLTIPPAPTATDASAITQTSFSANWNSTSGTTKYYLDVSTSSGFGTGTFVTGYENLDVGGITTYSVNTNINPGIIYYYRVRANNSAGTGANSNSINLVTIPPNPTTAAATNVNESSFNANWNSSSSATGYFLDVSTDAGFAAGNFAVGFENKDVGNVTTYSVTGLLANTTYFYRIRAYNGNGTSGNSGSTNQLTAPAVPNATAATLITQNSFSANWDASAGATGYRLDVSTNSGFAAGSFVTGYLDKDVGDVITYSVNTNLVEGTTYYYRVRAYSLGGTSTSSGTINLKTIPKAPVASSASSITSTSFDATWNSSIGASGYLLDVSTDAGFGAGNFVAGYADKDVSNVVTSTVNSGLSAGTTYYYRIRAYNSGGTSGNSGTVTVITVPSAPTATNASSIQATSITANWNASASATGYTIDISTDSNFGSYFDGFNNFDAGNVTSLEITGLSSGVTYYYRLRAYNVSGSSSYSNVKSAKTLSPAPVATTATLITGTSFSANWNASTGATGYYLDVATDNIFTSFVAGYNDKDVGNVTTQSVSGLVEGTNYYYRIRAYNASGTGSNSNVKNVKTIPPAPVDVAASSITNNSFNANWNSSAGANGYYLDVATDNIFTSFVAGFNGKNVGDVTTYSVTGLSETTSYYYRVRAYNNGGTSDYSGTQNPTTLANTLSVPSIQPASAVTSTSFSANWNSVTGATKYYLDVSAVSNFLTFVTDLENVDVGNVVTYSVNTNLSAGNTYYYRVRASNGSSTSGNSNTISVKTIPSAPVEQAATNIASTNFDANWNSSSGATGYYLDVATDNGFTSWVSGFNNRDVGNVTTFTVTGLLSTTQYFYRIRAYNTGGTSSNSGTANATTLAGATVIATAATEITWMSFRANWNVYVGATGYKLDVATDPSFGAGTFVIGYQNLDFPNGATHDALVSGAEIHAGTNYYYRITAYNAGGDIGTSGTINVLTLPADPTAAAATSITEISFNANWNSVTSATGYYLDVAIDDIFTTYVTGFQNKYVNNVTTYAVNGLASGTNYYYRVRAKNGSGTGPNSSVITVLTTPDEPVATSATGLTNNSISANWNASTGAAGYRLDVSTVSNFASYVGVYNNLDVNNVITYSVTGLSGGTNYYYRIRAYNGSGTSSNSNTISALTLPANPNSTPGTSITQTSFDANWDAVTGATKYYLDVATTSSFDVGTYVSGFQNLDVNSVTSFSITGLTGGINYYYRVRAFNTTGTSGNSATQNVLTIPSDPIVNSATNIQSTSFTANWEASTNATGYKLDVSTVSNFASFVGIYNDLDVGNVISRSVTGLSGGTTYYYRVRAYNGNGTSNNSGTMNVVQAPVAPVATAANSLNVSSFQANWNSSSGADGYRIDVATDAGFTSLVGGFNNKDAGTATSLVVTGLNSGSTYYYQVRSYSSSRTSGNSNSISALTVPAAPVATSASSVNESSFVANWNTSTGATKYYLDVATNQSFTTFAVGYNNKDVSNVLNYSVTGLSANTYYYYRVRAENASGVSTNSNTINVLSAPSIPVSTAATSITNTSFKANWNSSVGATGYFLDVSTASNFSSFVGIYNNKDVGSVTNYSVSGLSGSTNYYYRVRAYNSGGTSGNSGTISLTTAVDPSGVPTATAASNIAETSFSANWNPVAGAAGYKLDVSTDWNFGAGTFVTNFNDKDVLNVATYSVIGLVGGTTYYYRVRSYNASGTSSSSGSITVLTLPPPPNNTAATAVASTSFNANWNSATSATGYYLDVATDAGFTSYVATFNNKDVGNVTTYSVTGLNGGTNYYYRIRAYNANGTSSNSGTTTVLTIPSAPSATSASSVAETTFDSNWNSVTGAIGYRLDVSTTSGFDVGTFVTGFQNKDVSNVLTYSVTGLTGGTTYYYRIRAYNASGTSSNSNTINVQTISDAPIATSATSVTGTSFSANWNSVAGTDKYYLDVSTDSGFGVGSFVAGYDNKDVGSVSTYSISSLTVNTNYYYRIRSNNSGGTSSNSNVISVLTAPTAPIANSATSQEESSFTANWNASTGSTGYRVDVSTDANFAGGAYETDYENKDVGNVTSTNVTGITPETTHFYRIRAYSANGSSNNSNIIKVLGIPTALDASAITPTSFSANWSDVPSVTGYKLDVSTDYAFSPGTFIAGYQNKDVGNVTTYQISGLPANITHYYRVRSYDIAGSSGNSNTITVRNIPDAPTAINATSIGKTSFQANWNASVGGAVGYFIDVAVDAGFTNFVSGYQNKIVYNVTSYLITGVNEGTTYYYRVRAYNSAGQSANSNITQLTTIPSVPVAISASSITPSSFVANWNLVSGASGYTIDVAGDFNFTNIVPGYNNYNVGNTNNLNVLQNLAAGTIYFYRIRAYNDAGTSSNSNVIQLITIPPAPIATSASSITSSSFTANWNIINGATGYTIDVASDINFTNILPGYNNYIIGNANNFKVSQNLIESTIYYYRIRAYNESGSSANSNTIQLVTAFSDPIAITASSISPSSFVANWNIVGGATGYVIDVSLDNNFTNFISGYNNLNVGNLNSYTISQNLTEGTTYYYRVRAYNLNGTSNNSNIIQVTTIYSKPIAPLALNASNIKSDGFTANWSVLKGAAGYYLDIATDKFFNDLIIKEQDITNVSFFLVNGLHPAATYFYRVRAYNSSGVGDYSNTIEVTTLAIYEVLLTVNPNNCGVVSGGGKFTSSSSITISATPNCGYKFLNWTEQNNIVSTSPDYTFNINSNRNLVANFIAIEYQISIISNPTEGGTVSGGGIFNIGNTVNLNASANPTYTFVNWTIGNSEVSNSPLFTFIISEGMLNFLNIPIKGGTQNIIANFQKLTDVREMKIGIPKQYELYNNYPNPFNPSTVIRFGLPYESHVKIIVYDILGKEVTKIVDEERPAGYYEVTFIPENLPSGIYIYCLQTKNYKNSRKMLFMK